LNIDHDADCFWVRVRLPEALGPISITIKTEGGEDASHNDNATEVELLYEPITQYWTTQTQILVSDPIIDNAYETTDRNGNKVPNNAKNDRSHVVELGGKVIIESIKMGNDALRPLGIELPVKIKREVRMRFARLADTTLGTNENNAINPTRNVRITNGRLAQVGIKIKQIGDFVVIPIQGGTVKAVDMVPSDPDDPNSTKVPTLGVEPRLIVDAYNNLGTPVADNEILVVYCKHIFYTKVINSQDVSGLATFQNWMLTNYDEADAATYTNKVFLSGLFQKPFTMPHEIGHLLTNNGHYGINYAKDPAPPTHRVKHNLMRAGTVNDSVSIGDSKRLVGGQQFAIDQEQQPQ